MKKAARSVCVFVGEVVYNPSKHEIFFGEMDLVKSFINVKIILCDLQRQAQDKCYGDYYYYAA